MRAKLLLLLLLASCTKAPKPLTSAPPSEPESTQGTDVGSAGDKKPFERGTAWFVDSDRRVRYCIALGPKFPFSKSIVEASLKRAVTTWADYADRRGAQLINLSLYLPALTLDPMPECDGTEDLAIHAGTSGSEVSYQKRFFDNPLAFAVRTAYDQTKLWGKGFIYLADGEFLDAILLHEMGHVLGNAHIPGTIMDEGIAGILEDARAYERETYKIDLYRELLACHTCAETYRPEQPSEALFKLIAGRLPEAPFDIHLVRDFEAGWKELVLSDKKGTLRFDETNSEIETANYFAVPEKTFAFSFFENFSIVGLPSEASLVYRSLRRKNEAPLLVGIEDNLRSEKPGPAFDKGAPLIEHPLFLHAHDLVVPFVAK